MDERIRNLLDVTLEERFEIMFADIRKAEVHINEMIVQSAELSEKIHCDRTVSPEVKEMIESYLDLSAELENSYQSHLYIQGARDCVEVLRELGIIK